MAQQSQQGFLFMDACVFEMEARRRNLFLDFQALQQELEVRFGCVFAEKHYFNSVENPNAKSDYLAALQRLGWIKHLFPFKVIRRQVGGGADLPVSLVAPDGSKIQPLAGTYEFTVQAGVDSALTTAMSLLHGKAAPDAKFILIAGDGDFLPTLTQLREAGREVHVVFWESTSSGNPFAASLTQFLKKKTRQPGELDKYVYLDEILTKPYVTASSTTNDSGDWTCACGFANKACNAVCGGTGAMGCKAEKPTAQAPEWVCECGFKNRSTNEFCGGIGPMGCKKYKPISDPVQAPAWFQSCDTGQGYFIKSQLCKHWSTRGVCRMGDQCCFAHGSQEIGAPQPVPDRSGASLMLGVWYCTCGFSNNAVNTVCGGTGEKGCKKERPHEWLCDNCGFKNNAINEVCGGRGTKGCKKPKSQVPSIHQAANSTATSKFA